MIQAAVDRWWPDLRVWRLWRAQLFQESRCNANAVSPVGAEGLAQIMPRTGRDLAIKLHVDPMTSPHDAKFAIPAGAAYMAQLRSVWRHDRPPLDQHWLAVPSYNAGVGSLLKAQSLCHDAKLWPEIAPCLLAVTGDKFSAETLTYVIRIQSFWQQMEAAR